MPDVAFYYEPKLMDDGSFPGEISPKKLRTRLKPRIAAHMDCEDEKGRKIIHMPEQITFIAFAPLPEGEGKEVVMQIFGYDWPDRMRNIDERMERIGNVVRGLLRLPQETTARPSLKPFYNFYRLKK